MKHNLFDRVTAIVNNILSVVNDILVIINSVLVIVVNIETVVIAIGDDVDDIEIIVTDIQGTVNDIESDVDEMSEELEVIETHLHSNERWFERTPQIDGEIHVAVRIGTPGGLGAFIMDAGNNTWGSWIQILGSSDTPADPGKVAFDLHRIEISSAEKNSVYYIQLAAGVSGAQALIDKTVTEFPVKPLSNQIDAGPVLGQSEIAISGTKIWARCMCPGQNTGTMNFFPGIHEYDVIHE